MFKLKFGYSADLDLTCQVTDPGPGDWTLRYCGDCKAILTGYANNCFAIVVVSPISDGTVDAVLVLQQPDIPNLVWQQRMPKPDVRPAHPANYVAAWLTTWVNEKLDSEPGDGT